MSDISNANFAIAEPAVTVTSPNKAVSWRVASLQSIKFTHNLGAGQVVDQSNVNFKILSRITVTVPNTVLTWGAGTMRQIAWTHSLGTSEAVNIEFSGDAGGTWGPLATGVGNATATTGNYAGAIPTTPTTQALIRVSQANDPSIFDVSDVLFELPSPAITITAPNSNVNWTIGSTRTIKWTHNLGTLERVNIELSRDGGSTWESIALNLLNSGSTASTWAWVVTGPATIAARMRVKWALNRSLNVTWSWSAQLALEYP